MIVDRLRATSNLSSRPGYGDGSSQVRKRLLRRLMYGGAFLLLIAVAILLALRITYAGTIYPGVTIAGIDVGGLEQQDARDAVLQRTNVFEQNPLSFTYEGRTWAPTLADLGASINIDVALLDAYRIGREGNARDEIAAAGHLLNHNEQVPLQLSLDRATLDAWFSQVDEDLGQAARDASLELNGTTVSIQPDQDGLVIDRSVATEQVLAALRSLQPVSGPLPVSAQQPSIRAVDLVDDQETLQRVFANSVEVQFEQSTWTITGEDIAPFIERTENEGTYAANESEFSSWLRDQYASRVNRDAVDATVAWSAERKGLVALEPSVDGVKLKSTTFARAVIESFWGDHAPVTIPVSRIKPTIDGNNLKALGITTRLAVGDSSYEGSNDGRATNIEVGSTLLNGTLVPPGEDFSFNRAVGVIDEKSGFVEAQVIVGERIGRDIGGGICQVSTTVYRAALRAGLEITEWWPHTYRLAFYELDGWEPGFDASILQPAGDPFGGGDFRFTNTTDSWLLVESYTEGSRVIVIIYGPNLGYTIDLSPLQMSKPIPVAEDLEIVDETLPPGTIEQTETAVEGLETSFTRTVTDRDGNVVREDTWPTRFEPRGNAWRVSPDMKGKSPAGQVDS